LWHVLCKAIAVGNIPAGCIEQLAPCDGRSVLQVTFTIEDPIVISSGSGSECDSPTELETLSTCVTK